MDILELIQALAALLCACASAEIAEWLVLRGNLSGVVQGTLFSFPISLAIFTGLGINSVALAVYIGLTAKFSLTGLATISRISSNKRDKNLANQELRRLMEWRESILTIMDEIKKASLNPKDDDLKQLIDECRGKVQVLDTQIWALKISIGEEML